MYNDKAKHRLFLLDIIRIICALLIYGRHSITMYGCTYGHLLDSVICSLTGSVMTCFFVLSGFALYYQYSSKKFDYNNILTFYKNRLITILPSYYLIHFVYILFNGKLLRDWVVLSPIELFGIQSIYNSLFGILHNGGTWFVSCMLFCYFIYPIIQTIIDNLKFKYKIILLFVLYFIVIYSYYVVIRYGLDSNYSNPFFRCFEFLVGIIVASLLFDHSQENSNNVFVLSFFLCISIYGCLIHFIFNISVLNTCIIYLTIPAICWLLVLSSNMRICCLEKSSLLSVLSGMSYQFYLIQMFLWPLSDKIVSVINVFFNVNKLVVSFLTCTALSFIIYKFYDNPIKKLIKKHIK